ncbi:MAG: CPBP family intramembrane glutamic endopeptidase [Janthinobacterium lividum]
MKDSPARPVHPLLQILLLAGLAGVGLALASFVGLLLATTLLGFSMQDFAAISAAPASVPHGWAATMLLQGLMLAGLGAGAAVLPRMLGYATSRYFAPRRLGAGWWLLGAGVLIICSVPLLSALVSWNAGTHFPAALHDFELWAREAEDRTAELTKFLTNFSSASRLLVGLVVIAIVPAVAEELVFRGVLQRNLVQLTGSRHVGVWLAAAIFSAIHLQFFGFVPRFVLGLVLGYLFEWSGNILVSMAAHFTQNALQLLLLYLFQNHFLPATFDPDSTAALPWATVLVSGGLCLGLLYFLHQQFTQATLRQPPATDPAFPAR